MGKIEEAKGKTTAVRTFELQELRPHCQELFGVTPMVFDGALFDRQEKMTKADVKTEINAWLNKKVEARNQAEEEK